MTNSAGHAREEVQVLNGLHWDNWLQATVDGSVMTTHTADCAECDFRLAKVPARDWPPGSQRPVYLFASACE